MSDSIWKDLLVWQKDINAKDEALTRRKPIHDQALPPIRPSTEIVLDNLKPVGLETLSAKKTPPTKKSPTEAKAPKTRTERAEAEKAKGNEYFVKKDYNNAILYYGKAIDLDPTVPVYFVNRAMAYLKINSFINAEKDCTRGIQLQPKNVKAYWRRGLALKGLGRIEEARKDFEMGLTIEPNNKSLLDELKKLPPAATTATKAEKLKTKPVVEEKRRLPINVIDEAYSDNKKELTSKLEPVITKKSTEMTKHDEKIKIVEPKITPLPEKKIEVKTPEIKSNPIKKVEPKAPVKPITFTCPRTNFEFERDWKTYKGRGDDILYQYFQCIPPSSYATIFKSSLESDQFEKMLELLESRYIKENSPEKVFEIMEGLSQVKRVDMLIMFLSKKHQQAIQSIFEVINNSNVPKDKLVKVTKVFK